MVSFSSITFSKLFLKLNLFAFPSCKQSGDLYWQNMFQTVYSVQFDHALWKQKGIVFSKCKPQNFWEFIFLNLWTTWTDTVRVVISSKSWGLLVTFNSVYPCAFMYLSHVKVRKVQKQIALYSATQKRNGKIYLVSVQWPYQLKLDKYLYLFVEYAKTI